MTQSESETNEPQSRNFQGLRVLAFESRRADEMTRLIEKHGGLPRVSPSMREIPLEQNSETIDFAHRLITGEIGVVVFLTGVGFRHLLEVVERQVDRQRFLDALADITTIARGPKPVVAMQEVGLKPTLRVPEPNTWRELLAVIDASVQVNHQTVAIQEYGQPNPSLVAGLEARGASVVPIRVYRWDLPEDTGPLEQNVRALAAGEADVLLFTSAHQVRNVLEMARRLGVLAEVRAGFARAVVASIGPTTSETLLAEELPVDLEPEHPKMGPLVAAAAARSHPLLAGKRRNDPRAAAQDDHEATLGIQAGPRDAPEALRERREIQEAHEAWFDSPFMKACRREPTDVTPVWLMRQAGRYMAEYRAVREQTSFIDLCKNPTLCSEVMCTAVQRLGVDAAIIFSDLLPILEPMGLDLEYDRGGGPVIHNPVREPADVKRVLELETTEALQFVMETVRQTRADLPPAIPLIGFAGAPFTLASYTIEGGASRDYLHTKTLMYRDGGAWRTLMEMFVRAVTVYLNGQIAAGAQCVQLFDSWAGCLGPDDYRRYVLPYVQQIIAGITPGVPVISFATGNPALLPLLAEGGSAVVGIDWRVRLDQAWRAVGHDKAVQGNLDPAVLLADVPTIRRRVQDVLDQAAGRPGHIFNLGHGVMRQTPVEHAVAVVDAVHDLSQR